MGSRDQRIDKWNFTASLFMKDSDRAAAILASSYLEEALGEYIKLFLVEDSSIDELFRGYGPLSSFSARIGIAFATGLVTKRMRDDLNSIRKIRNHFAHHPAETSFQVPLVRDLCSNLLGAEPFKEKDGIILQETRARMQFLVTIGSILSNLETILQTQVRRVEPTALRYS
jgi:DNA-binding MltR family transcriptional regulator